MSYAISRITVAEYRRELDLRSKLRKKFNVTTYSQQNYLVVENVLNRKFMITIPSRVWLYDITYIQTKEGFVYLTTIIGIYDRKMIGRSLTNGINTDDPSDSEQAKQTTLAAWKVARRNRNVQKD